jgi:hypothetical protein
MGIKSFHWISSAFIACLIFMTPALATGQVVIHGVTGTIAPQISVDKFYSDANTLLVKTSDGIERLVQAPRRKLDIGSGSLDDLRPGQSVVVQYMVKGIQTSSDENVSASPDRPRVNEGTVTSIDRHDRHITVKFADGSTERLHLVRHASQGSDGQPGGSLAIVYTSNSSGQRVAHYFTPER